MVDLTNLDADSDIIKASIVMAKSYENSSSSGPAIAAVAEHGINVDSGALLLIWIGITAKAVEDEPR